MRIHIPQNDAFRGPNRQVAAIWMPRDPLMERGRDRQGNLRLYLPSVCCNHLDRFVSAHGDSTARTSERELRFGRTCADRSCASLKNINQVHSSGGMTVRSMYAVGRKREELRLRLLPYRAWLCFVDAPYGCTAITLHGHKSAVA